MRDIALGYGDQVLSGFIPREWIDSGRYLPLIMPKKIAPISDTASALARAVENPIGDTVPLKAMLRNCFKGGDIAILVDDYTRPNDHTRKLLPPFLELLTRGYGIPPERVKIVVCAGTHRAPTPAEMKRIMGEGLVSGVAIVVHDCQKDLARAGTLEGRPLMINRVAFGADVVIPLTDIDNHYFAGVAGGPKSFCPGICGKEIITWEHLHMFDDEGFADNVALGVLDGNPVYECKKRIVGTIIAEMTKHGRGVYCLAAITDPEGDLVYLEGGEIFAVHRAAARRLKNVWTVKLARRPEAVIAGAGTLGVNLYQAGKAIHAAYTAVTRGGLILAAVPCTEGLGDEEFRKLMALAAGAMARHTDHARAIEAARCKVIEDVRQDFKIGKQKAVDFLRILEHVGWGHLHIIQDGLTADDRKVLPFVFWGAPGEPALARLKGWVKCHAKGKEITVIDNPGYVVEIQ
ncbi:MAG: lactate racemase domain-containing protein [Candidatus Aureabacteria bacterium]|nr:lactate racemase domain-containing protein [Candidatus Auribacterota bacterium]